MDATGKNPPSWAQPRQVSTPLVSICLPNLNNRRFLEERMKSIYAQTLQDWELIIVDGFSEDGAWEFLCRFEADPRVSLEQAPRGLYASWNRCIAKARGEYVYIATSDDTMEPECLAKMAAALAKLPECDLCHCNLQAIDRNGDLIPGFHENCLIGRYLGAALETKHIRFAPHDGILSSGVGSVYVSVTQLLVRSSVFKRVGAFRTDLGAEADFEWSIRVGLTTNAVYLPEKLATWRIHGGQETQFERFATPDHPAKLLQMSELARRWYVPIENACDIPFRRLRFGLLYSKLALRLFHSQSQLGKIHSLIRFALQNPLVAGRYISDKFRPKSARFDSVKWIRSTLQQLALRWSGNGSHAGGLIYLES